MLVLETHAQQYQLTFDRIGLGQLSTVLKQVVWNAGPCLALCHAKVDMRTREVVNVKLWGSQAR